MDHTAEQYGGHSDFSEDDLALLFKHTQFEGKPGVTLKDLKRRDEIDLLLFAKLAGEGAVTVV